MSGKKIKRWSAGLLIITVVLAVMVLTRLIISQGPPGEEMAAAQLRLSEARSLSSGMPGSDPGPYLLAQSTFDSAMERWDEENRKFFLLRDYREVRACALKAGEMADEAIVWSQQARDLEIGSLHSRIRELKTSVVEFNRMYGHLPYVKADMDRLAESRLLLVEGSIALDNGDYTLAAFKTDLVEEKLSRLNAEYRASVEEYFKGYPQWNSWVEELLQDSRKHGTLVVVVDKFGGQCLVYRQGLLLHSYGIELGTRWMNPKLQEGDHATPEGIYTVIGKKTGASTRYHRALLIDYPNSADRQRFRTAQRDGILQEGARIGHGIEFHGMGGKGGNWTDGCIALRNEDMDQLYSLCSIGTRIAIVGSVNSLDMAQHQWSVQTK